MLAERMERITRLNASRLSTKDWIELVSFEMLRRLFPSRWIHGTWTELDSIWRDASSRELRGEESGRGEPGEGGRGSRATDRFHQSAPSDFPFVIFQSENPSKSCKILSIFLHVERRGGRRKAEGGRQKAEGGAMPQFELNLHRCRLIDLMSICGVTEIGSTLIHLLRPNPGDDRRPLAAVDSAGVAGNAHQVNWFDWLRRWANCDSNAQSSRELDAMIRWFRPRRTRWQFQRQPTREGTRRRIAKMVVKCWPAAGRSVSLVYVSVLMAVLQLFRRGN